MQAVLAFVAAAAPEPNDVMTLRRLKAQVLILQSAQGDLVWELTPLCTMVNDDCTRNVSDEIRVI
ncbi:hypothetical protein BWQ96_07800 [Gracilariopsis chorda]|uniref:Uncharacterized protein n=1 Tax=Gracilariopsis chorda TaxID=448386 RepID=A0A2V3IK57_9FLOR|nr:hypothetical protein BWQ96_07800 [Gracilariopsis chorda]|eukprot:PXF42462.1 hypothetical protein BWQ96_07800 [Gracilariopsis chorda]